MNWLRQGILIQVCLGHIVKPCLTDGKHFSFPMALPEWECLAAAKPLTGTCGVSGELRAHREDPMRRRGFMRKV